MKQSMLQPKTLIHITHKVDSKDADDSHYPSLVTSSIVNHLRRSSASRLKLRRCRSKSSWVNVPVP